LASPPTRVKKRQNLALKAAVITVLPVTQPTGRARGAPSVVPSAALHGALPDDRRRRIHVFEIPRKHDTAHPTPSKLQSMGSEAEGKRFSRIPSIGVRAAAKPREPILGEPRESDRLKATPDMQTSRIIETMSFWPSPALRSRT